MSDLISHPEYDFSSYQPGDVIRVSQLSILCMGQAGSIMFAATVTNAATRAGLDWTISRDVMTDDFTISFSEMDNPQPEEDETAFDVLAEARARSIA